MLIIILLYFSLLLFVSYCTSRNDNNNAFFIGNKRSRWYIVSFGMIGASLSGVTFVSVPGMVRELDMTYMQMVLGFPVGYFIIAYVLLPLYYKLNLISIYSFLKKRMGVHAYKTGALFFFLSKNVGAAARLYLVTIILQTVVFDSMNIPYWITVCGTVIMIWIYTYRSGIRTIVWTDTLQTFFMLLALVLIFIVVLQRLDVNFGEGIQLITDHGYGKLFEFEDWHSKQNFFKQFFSGIFITIVMTGLDQDMMQKNLSCISLKDAQKNMFLYGILFVPINLFLLLLGALILVFAEHQQLALPVVSDEILPMLCSTNVLGSATLIFFTIGIVAAAFSSADSALTALTTSFCVDLIEVDRFSEKNAKKIRMVSHLLVSAVFILIIFIFRAVNDKSVIDAIYVIASYTYGPLLGLYAFGLYSKRKPIDKWIPYVAIASPLFCIALKIGIESVSSYQLGYELLMLNGAITFAGLWLLSKKRKDGNKECTICNQ